jgi:hypothetical protein
MPARISRIAGDLDEELAMCCRVRFTNQVGTDPVRSMHDRSCRSGRCTRSSGEGEAGMT